MTYYYWDFDTDNVFLEEDEDGDTIAEYTHEPGLYGELIAQERDGQVRYYNFDGQGSTRELTDENGDVTDTYTYTAFGEEIAHTGTTENPFRYKGAWGYYTNSDTNDIYVRERVYTPRVGRWLSLDPARYPGLSRNQIERNAALVVDEFNLYCYVVNNPTNYVDPSGLECCCESITVSFNDELKYDPGAYGRHKRPGFRRGRFTLPNGEIRWYFGFAFVVSIKVRGNKCECEIEQTIDRVSGARCREVPITSRKGDDTPRGHSRCPTEVPPMWYGADTIHWQDVAGYRSLPLHCVPAYYSATFQQKCTGTDGQSIAVEWHLFHRVDRVPVRNEVSSSPNTPMDWIGVVGGGTHLEKEPPFSQKGKCC